MPKFAFLFPGQGAQYVGMGQQLCDTLPAARKLFDEATGILGYDLLEVFAASVRDIRMLRIEELNDLMPAIQQAQE